MLRFDSPVNTDRSTQIIAETPAHSNCFIGFHDVMPWSADGSCITVHRADPRFYRMEDCTKPIEICLWYPKTGEIRALDVTTGWNFQQGSRLQWVSGKSDCVAFNTVQNGRAVAVIRNVHTGERTVLGSAIYAISPDGRKSLSPDFAVLADRWKAYGYERLANARRVASIEEEGLWELDLDTGRARLFISTARAAAFEAMPDTDSSSHFLTHVSFSPDGSRVVFLHRFFSADGALYSRMIATDSQARKLTLLAQEKVSHFDWIDNETLLVWARFAGGGLAKARASGLLDSPLLKPLVSTARKITGRWKKRLLAEAYYKISINDAKIRSRYGWPALDADGHPMVARSHSWLVTDSYPDRRRQVPVILYHPERAERKTVIKFKYAPRTTDGDVKCDLHPRWDRSESLVAVDTCEAGLRQVKILDVSDIVRSASHTSR